MAHTHVWLPGEPATSEYLRTPLPCTLSCCPALVQAHVGSGHTLVNFSRAHRYSASFQACMHERCALYELKNRSFPSRCTDAGRFECSAASGYTAASCQPTAALGLDVSGREVRTYAGIEQLGCVLPTLLREPCALAVTNSHRMSRLVDVYFNSGGPDIRPAGQRFCRSGQADLLTTMV